MKKPTKEQKLIIDWLAVWGYVIESRPGLDIHPRRGYGVEQLQSDTRRYLYERGLLPERRKP